MSDMDLFKIRDLANEGIKVDLATPDGKSTDHWLKVRSIWSDDFQAARAEVLRLSVEDGKKAAGLKGKEAEKARKEGATRRQAALIASLISDWSFKDKPCTDANKLQFMLDAPQIRARVEQIADADQLFFAKRSPASSPGASRKSRSSGTRKAATAQPKNT